MVQECFEEKNTNLLVELLGTMVYIPSSNWEEVINKFNFLEFIHKNLVDVDSEDDVVLECIMIISTICMNNSIAKMISTSYLIKILQDLLGVKQEDDEMVQQILNTFFKFMFFTPTRDVVVSETHMVVIVLELLNDKNQNIKSLVNAILDFV